MNELDLSASTEINLKYTILSDKYNDIYTISQNTQDHIIYCLRLHRYIIVLNESFKMRKEGININFRTTGYLGEE